MALVMKAYHDVKDSAAHFCANLRRIKVYIKAFPQFRHPFVAFSYDMLSVIESAHESVAILHATEIRVSQLAETRAKQMCCDENKETFNRRNLGT
jgi:hypothetical protein